MTADNGSKLSFSLGTFGHRVHWHVLVAKQSTRLIEDKVLCGPPLVGFRPTPPNKTIYGCCRQATTQGNILAGGDTSGFETTEKVPTNGS
jgi:hypothetical protein